MISVNVDLHFHSSYAGGTGSLSLEDFSSFAPLKGIEIVGTGDVQFKPWRKTLENKLVELEDTNEGLFILKEEVDKEHSVKFLLQTEIILTTALKGTNKRKQSHTLVLFPNLESVEEFYKLASLSWDCKLEKIARPFILSNSPEEVGEKIKAIKNINALIEIIPAHIMTPDGVFGSNHKLNWLDDFYGEGTKEINAVETGLSADPELLYLIPEMDNYTFISNSDAHSATIQRIGREFSSLNVSSKSYSYKDLIYSIKNNKVSFTAEFMPSEGRYFLSGHKSSTRGHNKNEFCRFSPKYIPNKFICPLCNKELTIGALSRAIQIGITQGEERNFKDYQSNRNFFHFIPLVEVVSLGLGIKNPNSKRVVKTYMEIISHDQIKNESNFWQLSSEQINHLLRNTLDTNVLHAIDEIHSGNFSYSPGFDGIYGELMIGKKIDYFEINEVNRVKN
jgi:PHP family Zn ribbon phosphoesterase